MDIVIHFHDICVGHFFYYYFHVEEKFSIRQCNFFFRQTGKTPEVTEYQIIFYGMALTDACMVHFIHRILLIVINYRNC